MIGSLVEPAALGDAWPFALLLLALLVIAKTLPTWLLARAAGASHRPGQVAIGMSQLGEFSFVLGNIAMAAGALSSGQFVGILLAVIVSIIGSTVLVRRAGAPLA